MRNFAFKISNELKKKNLLNLNKKVKNKQSKNKTKNKTRKKRTYVLKIVSKKKSYQINLKKLTLTFSLDDYFKSI